MLFESSAAAEIKYGQKPRAAVRAYDNAQESDFYFTHLGELRTDCRPYKLGVAEAVGVKNVNLGSRAVNRSKVAEHAVRNELYGVFSAANFFCYVKSAAIGNIQNGLDIKQRADKRRGI